MRDRARRLGAAPLLLCLLLAGTDSSAAPIAVSQVRLEGPAPVAGLPTGGLGAAPGASLSAGSLQSPGLSPAASLSAPSVRLAPAPAPVRTGASLTAPLAPALPAAASAGRASLTAAPAPGARTRTSAPALSPERRAQYQELSASLSPARADAPAEQTKQLSDRFFDAPSPAPAAQDEGVLAPERSPAQASLAPASAAARRAPAATAAPQRQGFTPDSGPLVGLQDRVRYAQLTARHLYWYTITHMQELWPSYQGKRRALMESGETPAVSRPREFFTAMRVVAESGIFYVLGYSALNDGPALVELRRAFQTYFDGPGIGAPEREAYERFLGRIAVFNKAHRAHSNMRKHVRDALLAASLMPPRLIAGYFDSLAVQDKSDQIDEFQREEAPRRLKAFGQVVQEALAEETSRGDDRVLGVLLMGSFARGAATPTSDMDVELLTRAGDRKRVKEFNDRLVARWEALGLQKENPITPHEDGLYPSWGLIARIHRKDYRIYSPDESLVAALSPAPGPPAYPMVRDLTLRGRLGRLFEFCAVYAVTLWTDLRQARSR